MGWGALDESGLDAKGTVSIRVDNLLVAHPEIEQQLWNSMGMNIDGQVPGPDWYARWSQIDEANADKGEDSFLLELELPPALWFQIALYNGAENGTEASRRYRHLLDAADAGELVF